MRRQSQGERAAGVPSAIVAAGESFPACPPPQGGSSSRARRTHPPSLCRPARRQEAPRFRSGDWESERDWLFRHGTDGETCPSVVRATTRSAVVARSPIDRRPQRAVAVNRAVALSASAGVPVNVSISEQHRRALGGCEGTNCGGCPSRNEGKTTTARARVPRRSVGQQEARRQTLEIPQRSIGPFLQQ